MKHRLLAWLACAGFAGPLLCFAAEPRVDPNDLPRIQPLEPAEALKTFRIRPGFRIELAAAEPLIEDPIAFSFDENGRLYVVEMRGYSERRDEHLGRIKLLEDVDGDGRFDKATVFAENLPWPTAVICYGGGVFVGASPDIYYLKDTTGDGVADQREVVFTGFGNTVSRLNVQALLNSFTWGLDNRIHGATAGNGGRVRRVSEPESAARDLRGKDFAFDPRTFLMTAELGGGQYGLSFDSHGRKFVCSNSRHIQTFMYEARYASRNPFSAMPPGLMDIAVDGAAAEVFRTSPDEPWRVLRTHWRVSGVVPGIIEGGGRPSGYFTAATGITIFRGNARAGGEFEDAFIADCGSNLIHRKKIRRHGVGRLAERAPDERNTEFLTSTDIWFRPVQLGNAPDGALYIADMYREVIEHPWSLPEPMKSHLDLNSGNDRGRIYRIVPEDFIQPKPAQLGELGASELVKVLEHPNGWHRDTAARLLYERQDPAAAPELENLLANSGSAFGRLHALRALAGQNGLRESHLLQALSDRDAAVRRHAVELSERFFSEGRPSAALWKKLEPLSNDPDIEVRYQLAFTAGETVHPEKVPLLAAILRKDIAESWMRAAVLSSLRQGAGEMFSALLRQPGIQESPDLQNFLRELAGIIAAGRDQAGIEQVIRVLKELDAADSMFALTLALAEGLERGGAPIRTGSHARELAPIFEKALQSAHDRNVNETVRLRAIELLARWEFSQVRPVLLALLAPRESEAVQLAALRAWSRFTEVEVAGQLLGRWNSFTPRLRGETINVLLARTERVSALLAAMVEGKIRPADLTAAQAQTLRGQKDSRLREEAERLFASRSATPSEAFKNYQPALSLTGDRARGKIIFEERCASCHRFNGVGHDLGPDMATVRDGGKEKLLLNILDPNLEVAPNYLAWEIETTDGEHLTGMLAAESAGSVILRQPSGIETMVPRTRIERIQSQNSSLMPEGLEAGLSVDEMAALLDYLTGNEGN
jgi:putative membrane-bound dehydrogenase-like protein